MYSKRQEVCKCLSLCFLAWAASVGWILGAALLGFGTAATIHSSSAFFNKVRKWLVSFVPQVEIKVAWSGGQIPRYRESPYYHSSLIGVLLPCPPPQSSAILFAFLSTCISSTSACLCECGSFYSGWTALLFPTLIS